MLDVYVEVAMTLKIDKERLRLSCSVTMYKGDRTRKTKKNADRHG
jgi:hypothetical protein